MKQIKVTINEDGSNIEFEVGGIAGTSCKDITQQFQEALGQVVDEKKTSEYYEIPIDMEVNINGG